MKNDLEEITIIVEADNRYEAELLGWQEAGRMGYYNIIVTPIFNNQWRVQLYNIKRKKYGRSGYFQ
jgi:hypothetical protein